MHLEQLDIFVAVAETGSTTAAADRVHLSQPAVSRNLKQLEEDLGVDLFDRSGRGLTLNAAGRALLPKAKAMREMADRTREETRQAAEREFFDLRIGTVDSIATYLFPDVVDTLKGTYPELELKLYTRRTSRLLDDVRAGELDVAIVAYSGPPPVDRVDEIGRYDMQFFGRRDLYPNLAEVERERELQEYPIVQLTPKPGQPSLIRDETTSFAMAGSLATIKSLVLGGFGVGSLLHYMISDEEREQLVRARIPHDPDCAVYAIRSPEWQGEMEDGIAETLIEELREEYPEP